MQPLSRKSLTRVDDQGPAEKENQATKKLDSGMSESAFDRKSSVQAVVKSKGYQTQKVTVSN